MLYLLSSAMAANILRATPNKLCWFVVLATTMYSCFSLVAIAQQVPCVFIFGDSLVDNGNNNHIIKTLAKADYPPYGIDFASGPSGRFCNGKTTVDVIAELLGFDKYIPPYTAAKGEELLKGVNYASAASGIRDESGQELGRRISFSGQVGNFKSTISEIVNLLGDEDTTTKHLSKCIYTINLGSNDYLNNYFLPLIFPTSKHFTPEQYADDLIQRYDEQLKIMYSYGARKFVLNGLGPIGCIPSGLLRRNSSNRRSCVQKVNTAIQIFNYKLKLLVEQLNQNTSDAKLIYLNSYGIFQELISNPDAHGFKVTNKACCGVGRNNGLITCLPFQIPCKNRSQYVFWDAFHPTEAANIYIGRRFYSAELDSDVYPYDIRQLAQI